MGILWLIFGGKYVKVTEVMHPELPGIKYQICPRSFRQRRTGNWIPARHGLGPRSETDITLGPALYSLRS